MKETIKSAVFHGLRLSGVNLLARRSQRARLLVLCYHGVVSDDGQRTPFLGRNTVTVAEFRRQLRVLRKLFNPISADDLLDHLCRERELKPGAVLVTFDDGFRNNLTLAAPLLLEEGVPAVFHVTTAYIGTREILWPQRLVEWVLRWPDDQFPLPGHQGTIPVAPAAEIDRRIDLSEEIRALCKQLPDPRRQEYLREIGQRFGRPIEHNDPELYDFMTWDEVRKLHGMGFAIGSHTVNHPILTRLEPQQLRQELAESRAIIERELGAPCRILAYPNGGRADFSPSVMAAAGESGYEAAFSLMEGTNAFPLSPFAIDRVTIGGLSHAEFNARVSGSYGLLRKY